MRDEPFSGDRSLHETAQAFTGVLVHDRADLDRFPTLTDIKLEIDCPHDPSSAVPRVNGEAESQLSGSDRCVACANMVTVTELKNIPARIRNRADYRLFLDMDLAAHDLHRWRFHYRVTRPELLFQRTLRAAEYYDTKRGLARLPYYLHRVLLKRRSLQTGIAISPGSCGPGLSVPHYGSVIIHKDARLGAFCRVHSATNIGTHKGAAPHLGDFVYVAPGAVIYGGVTIGSHTMIGAGTVVGRTVPPNTTVIGSRVEMIPDRPYNRDLPEWITDRICG